MDSPESREQSDPASAHPCPPLRSPYAPYVIAFGTAAALMVMEMVAGRVIARLTGNSLYSWTSVIGVILTGITLGNYIGGRIADSWRPHQVLGWLFLGASASCISTLFISHYFQNTSAFTTVTYPTMVFMKVLCTFLWPALMLGMFGPVTAKMAVENSQRVGLTLGAVSAWGAAGSICGTLLAGFWLVSALGTKGLPQLIALGLASAGMTLGPRQAVHAVWLGIVAAALFLSQTNIAPKANFKYRQALQETLDDDVFARESDYQFVRVYDRESESDPDRMLRVLVLDHLIHGYVDPDDPSHLEYHYEKVYCDVARRYAGSKKRISAFFIGGGSYTFPRWTLNTWPGSKISVAEIDPMVLEANHVALGLPRDTPIRTYVMDARRAVEELPPGERYDFFFGDAFNDLSTPFHLTTLEFVQKVDDHLAPDGAYLVNIIDSYKTALLLGSITCTLERVFEHVYVFCTDRDGVRPARDTFVIAASHKPLDVSDWGVGHKTDFCGSALTPWNMAFLRRICHDRVLTDDDAPVENLIAPVVRGRTEHK